MWKIEDSAFERSAPEIAVVLNSAADALGIGYCKKRIHTMNEFMDHFAKIILPRLFGMLESKPQ